MKKNTLIKYLEYAALCDLKSKDYKVLLYLFSELMDMEEIKINQSKVAEELGITKSDVSKSLRKLEKNKILRFKWITERKKRIALVEYHNDELGELIEEKIEIRTNLIEEW
jgi:predicted transcriptional regulator